MLRRILKIIALPLAVLGVFALLYAVWVVLDLPPEQTIIEIAKPYLERYGAALVLACAFIEGLLLIGWYFPGTLVVIFGLKPGLLLNLFSSTVTETLDAVKPAAPIAIPPEVTYGVVALIAVLVIARTGWALIHPRAALEPEGGAAH